MFFELFEKRGNGYDGYSMSNNARQAYAEDKQPLSRWTKSDIIEVCERLAKDNGLNLDMNKLSKLNLYTLKQLLSYAEYHHTGKYFNVTDFYEVDPDLLAKLIADGYPKEEPPKKPKIEKVDTGLYAHGSFVQTIWTRGKWARKIETTHAFINAKIYEVYKDGKLAYKELWEGKTEIEDYTILKTTKRKIKGLLSSKQSEKLKKQIDEAVTTFYKRTKSTDIEPKRLDDKITKILKTELMTTEEAFTLRDYAKDLMKQYAKGAK